MSDWKNVQYKNGKMRTSEGGGGGGSSTFAGLDDVDFSNLQDGQVAKYDAQNQKWVNANESGGQSHTYSTTEQVVGTWIDGKPIYEKSYNVGSIARNTRAEVDSTLSIDKIISCNGGAYSSTYNQKYPMPFVHTNTAAYAIMVYVISGVLYVQTGNDMPVSECHITVQYTKSTD